MSKTSGKIAVIIYGPPGSGKGTQAKLLADEFNLFHFDTGDYLRAMFYGHQKLTKELQKEKKINEAGGLNTPSWVLKIVSQRINHLAELGQSIILSGSPRTLYEAFGDKAHGGIIKLLSKKYGRENVHVVILQIPENESIKRNSMRSSCSVCKTSFLSNISGISTCPICGGKIEHRKDDKKEIVTARLKEYHKRTEPIFSELRKNKYNVVKINGTPAPYKVHRQIVEYFK